MSKRIITTAIALLLICMILVAARSMEGGTVNLSYLPLTLRTEPNFKVSVDGNHLVDQRGDVWREWGINSPENLFAPHMDWYLFIDTIVMMKINSVYSIPHNIGGDANDTDFNQSDVGELRNKVTYANENGVLVHIVLAESERENKTQFGGWSMTPERMNYFDTLIGNLSDLAITWIICEECDLGIPLDKGNIEAMAHYIRLRDPITPIGVHMLREGSYDIFNDSLDIDMYSVQLVHDNLNLIDRQRRWNDVTDKAILFHEWCSVDVCTPDQIQDAARSVENVAFYVASDDQNMTNPLKWIEWVYPRK